MACRGDWEILGAPGTEQQPQPSVEPLQPLQNAPPAPLPWDSDRPLGNGGSSGRALAVPPRATSVLVDGPSVPSAA